LQWKHSWAFIVQARYIVEAWGPRAKAKGLEATAATDRLTARDVSTLDSAFTVPISDRAKRESGAPPSRGNAGADPQL